jgi:TRAP-type C4-dicarboxylate transport system permease small subunit
MNKFFMFVERLEKLCKNISGFLFIVLTLIMSFGVLNRNIFKLPGMWAFDLAGFVLVWFAFFSSAGCIPNFENIKIPIIIQRVPLKLRRKILIVIYLLNLFVVLVFFMVGISLTISGASMKVLTLGVSMALPYSAVPIASFIMSLSIIKILIKFYRGEDIEKYK